MITHETSHAIPFYMGYHPYFRVSNVSQTSIKLDGKYYELITKGSLQYGPLIPTGESILYTLWNGTNLIGMNESNNFMPNYFDNGYRSCLNTNNNDILYHQIKDHITNITQILWQDSNFRFNQLFTGLYQHTGESGIAFEPQSGSTNGYNNGDHLTVLYPGQEFVASFGFKVL